MEANYCTRHLRWLTAMMVILVCALIAPPSFAQGPSAQDKESARTYMDMGDEKMKERDYKAALKAYKAADEIMNVPTTGMEVAKVLQAMGLLIEANQKYIDVFRLPVKAGESKLFAKTREEAYAKAEEVRELIPSVEIKITGMAVGVVPTAAVDGKALRASAIGLPSKVNPGEHTIQVSAPGYKTVTRKFTVKEKEKHDETFSLVTDPNYVAAPSPKLVEPKPKPKPPSDNGQEVSEGGISPLVFVGFGVAGAGIIAGAITGGLSLSQKGDIKTTFNCDSNNECDAMGPDGEVLADDISAADTMANVSNVALAVAGAGAVVGVIGLFLGGDSSPKKADHLAIYPTIGHNTMGVGVAGRF